MGGLGIDARDKLEVAANATVTVGDGSAKGNVHVGDSGKFIVGADDDLQLHHTGSNGSVDNITGDLNIRNYANDKDVNIQTDDGSGGVEVYFRADGSTSESILFYSGNEHLKTQQTGAKVTGNVDVTANIGIAGNAVIGTYMSIANTNPAATDALVIQLADPANPGKKSTVWTRYAEWEAMAQWYREIERSYWYSTFSSDANTVC